MTPRFSNEFLSHRRDSLFTTSNDKFNQAPMVGRQEETAWFQKAASDLDLRVIRLWAPMGSGKTFFLNQLWGTIQRADLYDFNEDADTKRLAANQLPATVDEIDALFPERPARARAVLVVEEFDRKYRFEAMAEAAHLLASWVRNTALPAPLLVLTGDAFLNHPVFDEVFADWPNVPVTLEPLDEVLLSLAIASRLDQSAQVATAANEPSEEAMTAAATVLADPAIARGLLPPTTRPVATFRDALVTLSEMMRWLPPDKTEIRIDQSVLRMLAVPSPGEDMSEELCRCLLGAVAEAPELAPHSALDLAQLVRASISPSDLWGDVEDYEAGVFTEEAVVPLVTGLYLVPLGVPFLHDDGSVRPGPRVRGPFLPTPTAYRVAQL